MDKKKGIIPAIIVLLLCVLGVVGAAYAYYSVVGSSSGGTGTVSAKSDEVGNVSLSGDGGSLHINLTPSDVSNVAGGVFYGTATDAGYVLTEETLEVAKIETTSTPANVTYTCTFDIKVTPNSGNLDGVLGGEILFTNTNLEVGGITSDKLAFSSLTETKTYKASTTLEAGTNGSVLVAAKITSSDSDGNESWLSNINGSFSVSSDNLKCTASTGNGGSSSSIDPNDMSVLYNKIKAAADTTTTLNLNKTAAESNTHGIYTTTSTDSGAPVYFYRGTVDNNIIFGGFCWKIVRTTETKGVKLLYNGVPSNGTCVAKTNYIDGGRDINLYSAPLSTSKVYYYGTSYTFDETTGNYKMSGTITSGTWSSNHVRKYTLMNSDSTATGSILYYV